MSLLSFLIRSQIAPIKRFFARIENALLICSCCLSSSLSAPNYCFWE